MVATYDKEEQIIRLLDNAETNDPDFDLDQVEDDSSWEKYCCVSDIEKWLGCDPTNPDAPVIVERRRW